MPRTFPARSWVGLIVASRISTTRDVFSSTTPIAMIEPELLVLGRELQLRLQVADTLAEGDGSLGCRRVTVEEVVPDEGADHDNREHHGHRDDVGLRQHPGLDFALGDHPHRPGPHRVTFPAAAAIAASSADTTSRNRSIRLGRTGENS